MKKNKEESNLLKINISLKHIIKVIKNVFKF